MRRFATRFVKKRWRDRFCHEFNKKPQGLHARICHSASDLFVVSCLHPKPKVAYLGRAIALTGARDVQVLSWEAVDQLLGNGSGLLAISESGEYGLLETEATRGDPAQLWYVHA